MPFDPSRVAEETCVEGRLDGDPFHEVLRALHAGRATGRLTLTDAAGDNHMYFMQGAPVGVVLAESLHPLGQLLLELGKVDGQTFVRAQRQIDAEHRLPGQVFQELGILDERGLMEVLAVQARRKAEHFCQLGANSFSFCRGKTFLTGFTSTPINIHAVIFLALRQQMTADHRAAYLDAMSDLQVRVEGEPLPAPASAFGFGAPEERFLQRLVAGWERVQDLADTGTLPRDEMAVLLRFLDVSQRLQTRKAVVPAGISALFGRPKELEVREGEDVFSTSQPLPRARPAARVPAAVSAVGEPTPDPVFAGPNDATDPKQRLNFDEQTQPLQQSLAVAARRDDEGKLPGGFRSVMFAPADVDSPPPAPAAPPSVVISDDLPAPVVRKKKVKRAAPLPSAGSGTLTSETRKERTNVGPLPSIVFEPDDE